MAPLLAEIVAATSLVETQTSMATLLGGIVTVRPHDVVLIHLVIPLADNNL